MNRPARRRWRKPILLLFAATLFLVVVACALFFFLWGRAKTMSRDELFGRAIEAQGNSFPPIMYYTGSDARYDYYDLDHGAGRAGLFNDERYRVPRGQKEVTSRFAVTAKRSNWIRIYPPAEWDQAIRSYLSGEKSGISEGPTTR